MGTNEKSHILVVDDSVTNLKIAEQALKPMYKVTSLISGEQALKFLAKNKPDLILLDIKMSGMDGFDTIRAIKQDESLRSIPVIFLTAISDSECELQGLKLGAIDFINKPFVPEVMLRRVSMQIELNDYRINMENLVSEKTKIVEKLQDAIVLSITDLVEFRDKITGGHARRTAKYLEILLNHIKEKPEYSIFMSDEFITNILRAAPLHDVGKIGINDNVLMKTGTLESQEFEYMKQHTKLGGLAFERALDEVPGNEFLQVAMEMAIAHHERWDGTGYPYGLSKEDIPFSARLMAIADVYDALTTKRAYKDPMSHEDAIQLMTSLKGTHFQPELIDELVMCQDEFKQMNSVLKEKYVFDSLGD